MPYRNLWAISLVYLIIASAPSFAYNITINRNVANSKVCEGAELTFTCTSQSTFHRWIIQTDINFTLVHKLFREVSDLPGTSETVQNRFHFTLISTASHHFVSTFSTVATNDLNNAVVECADISSRDTTTIRIQGLYRHHDRNFYMMLL